MNDSTSPRRPSNRVKIAPETPLAVRVYNFLKKWDEANPDVFLPKEKIIAIASSKGEDPLRVSYALKELENVNDVCCFWDKDLKTMVYSLPPMSDEVKKKRQEDFDWFESLPG